MQKLIAALIASVLLLPLAALGAQSASKGAAQAYPTKPIRFIISFGPGSASDALARIAGQELTQSLGQPVVVLPKPGADGALSGMELKRATPDGYTFLFGSNSALAVVVGLRKEPPYDPTKDFTPITYLGDNTFFIVVHPSVPAKSIAELVAYAKANPKATQLSGRQHLRPRRDGHVRDEQRHLDARRSLQVGARRHARSALGPRAAPVRHLHERRRAREGRQVAGCLRRRSTSAAR